MDIVDHAGHSSGPEGDETNQALVEADRIIGIMMDGLKQRRLENCVNIIMLADHGKRFHLYMEPWTTHAQCEPIQYLALWNCISNGFILRYK